MDDERYPPADVKNWVIARTLGQVQQIIINRGAPTHISFDHDLGSNCPTGYDIAKWLVEFDMDDTEDFSFPENFTFYVHSQNPVGKKNIEEYLKNYFKFKTGS